MSRSISFRPEAFADAQRAYDRYEDARPGLGEEFIAAVDEALDRAREHPTAYRVLVLDMRRVLMTRFPYAIYFVDEDDAILVIAVFHGHQDTERLTERR